MGAPKDPLSSNLVPLSLQLRVNLALLAPTCTLTSQLSINFGFKLPSKLNFSLISDPLNLDFCNTLQRFSRFFNISTNCFETAVQAPKSSPNSPKMFPKCSSEAPKSSQDLSKRLQDGSKRSQDASSSLQDHPHDCLGAFQSSHMISKMLQEASKSLPRAFQRLLKRSKKHPRDSQMASKKTFLASPRSLSQPL